MKLTDIMLGARIQGKKYFIQNSNTGKTEMTEVRQGTSGQERRVEWELTDKPPESLSGAGTFHVALRGAGGGAGAHTGNPSRCTAMVCTKHEHTGN